MALNRASCNGSGHCVGIILDAIISTANMIVIMNAIVVERPLQAYCIYIHAFAYVGEIFEVGCAIIQRLSYQACIAKPVQDHTYRVL